jgi:energy-coupling factor transport system permease protein
MFVYTKRNTFLQGLHPLAGILLIILYMFNILFISNPIYLLISIVLFYMLTVLDGCSKEVMRFTRFIIPIAFFIAILNPVVNQNGSTVLFEVYKIPIIGSVRFTLEALLYGFVMGIRLIGITMVFGFGNLVIHPDRAFSFFSRYFGKSAFLMSMTLRLFPTIINSYNNIVEVEKLRGNQVFVGGFISRLKKQSNIVNIIFMSCLEDAADMAESMYSRGYGSGKRSVYFYDKFSMYDKIFMFISFIYFVVFAFYQMKGLNEMNFYPNIDNIFNKLSITGWVISLLLFVPIAVNWGWKAWK